MNKKNRNKQSKQHRYDRATYAELKQFERVINTMIRTCKISGLNEVNNILDALSGDELFPYEGFSHLTGEIATRTFTRLTGRTVAPYSFKENLSIMAGMVDKAGLDDFLAGFSMYKGNSQGFYATPFPEQLDIETLEAEFKKMAEYFSADNKMITMSACISQATKGDNVECCVMFLPFFKESRVNLVGWHRLSTDEDSVDLAEIIKYFFVKYPDAKNFIETAGIINNNALAVAVCIAFSGEEVVLDPDMINRIYTDACTDKEKLSLIEFSEILQDLLNSICCTDDYMWDWGTAGFLPVITNGDIDKACEEIKQRQKQTLHIGHVFKSLPQEHIFDLDVRGHLRHLKSGKIVSVKAHMRHGYAYRKKQELMV